ncbi:MAG: diphthine synthase [Candidatus Aenigmarchaeota archaeon]|nr:diphthine synthase [Candidatus Aenigmarchaeota archaeon]
MLYLIGLGLGDEKDITLRGMEIAKKCECFVETYTSKWEGDIRSLERIVGNNIKQIRRKDLEDNQKEFLKNCEDKDVALFVLGDPLAATTHIDLVIEAKNLNIPVKIIHNSSVFSALGEFGLQMYKYGRTVTIPFSNKLDSVRDALKSNKKAGLHTLLLLDLDAEVGLYMKVKDALKLLLDAKLIKKNDKIISGKIGKEIYYDSVSNMLEKEIETPSAIVIPGKLHFREKEYLEMIK